MAMPQQIFYPGTSGNRTARNFMPGRVAAAQQMMGMPPQMALPPQQTQVPVAAPMQEQAPKPANRPQTQGFRPKRKRVSAGRKKADNTLRDARTAADVVGTVAGTATTAANAALAAAPAAAAGAGAGAALSAVPVVGPILGGIAALASFGIAESEKKKAEKEARRQEAFGALQNTLQSRFS